MIEKILSYMLLDENNRDIQKIQTQHRINLATFWGVKPGDKILEIGCGQGDTTAVLAEMVGEAGEVVAVDIAHGDYGAPYTLAQSIAKIAASPLGARIQFHLDTDFLSDSIVFPNQCFDKIILSHCSWYFDDKNQLAKIIEKSRHIAKTLCYAEWDSQATHIAQLAHLHAVLIQNQYALLFNGMEGNVRTLITKNDVSILMAAAGWALKREQVFQEHGLQDGTWEVAYVGSELKEVIINDRHLGDKKQQFLLSQIEDMVSFAKQDIVPLNVFSGVWG